MPAANETLNIIDKGKLREEAKLVNQGNHDLDPVPIAYFHFASTYRHYGEID